MLKFTVSNQTISLPFLLPVAPTLFSFSLPFGCEVVSQLIASQQRRWWMHWVRVQQCHLPIHFASHGSDKRLMCEPLRHQWSSYLVVMWSLHNYGVILHLKQLASVAQSLCRSHSMMIYLAFCPSQSLPLFLSGTISYVIKMESKMKRNVWIQLWD